MIAVKLIAAVVFVGITSVSGNYCYLNIFLLRTNCKFFVRLLLSMFSLNMSIVIF
uniref:Uncharacterized protein n=1 Tax=Arundo donax TaxID=35708 RepID=A0A0A9EPY0_ARUDO